METIPERMIEDLQEDLGLEKFQAEAVAGNLAQETGNFRVLKENRGSGFGYSQWSGNRRDRFFNFAARVGDRTSYDVNYGFLVAELQGPYLESLHRLRSTDTLEEATAVFMKSYLRPAKSSAALKKRISYAKNFSAGRFDGAGCATVHVKQGNRLGECPSS